MLLSKLGDNRRTRPIKEAAVRALASWPVTRTFLNAYVDRLSDEGKSRYHQRYAKIFKRQGASLTDGQWTLHFTGKPVTLPLRSEHAWLDWDHALSILGHDIEIKTAYRRLIASDSPPEIFLDVGANYGTHSILFASAGIPVVAFEPNPHCFDHFNALAGQARQGIRWEPVALGEEAGEADLVFPPTETWLGSVEPSIGAGLRQTNDDIACVRIPLRRLDDYAGLIEGKQALIKIDVEGHEASVLRGGAELLRRSRPTIVFESNDSSKRAELQGVLAAHGYTVVELPPSGQPGSILSKTQFEASSATNFMTR